MGGEEKGREEREKGKRKGRVGRGVSPKHKILTPPMLEYTFYVAKIKKIFWGGA
jgi:hypothetical protein